MVELRYNSETFSHGIAPISYNWQCANNVLKMYLPGDVKGLEHGQKFIHQSIRLRNNENRDDKAIF